MKFNKTSFPVQKIPASKKNDDWRHATVDYIVSMGEVVSGGMTRTRFEELQTYYNLYNSIFNEKDLKHVTNPYKVDDSFPATPQDMNIIRPCIDLLVGEETKHPFNFRVTRTSDIGTSEMQDKLKDLLMQYMMSSVMAGMSQEEQQQYQEKLQNGEIQTPEQIQKYLEKDYKDIAESVAYHSLQYLHQKLNLDHEFIKGWKDALIAGEEVYYIGILNGEPYLERVNPMFFAFDKSPDLEFIEDGDWACRRMRLSYTEVYDRFYDKMNEEQLDRLLTLIDGKPGSYGADKNMIDDFNKYSVRIVDNPTFDFRSRNTVNVWHACWRSFKKIAYVTFQDDMGQVQQTIVDETYKKTGNELKIEWDWVLEVWEGYRIGQDLYVGCQPIEYQHVSIDNPNSNKLPYTGVIYSNTNSIPKSLVSIMKPLQYMYIVLWYRLELALARDKGKVINMDITQIPKSMNITPERWMHYLSAVGVNFINPYEEGWDIPGREGGKPASFNQITSLDLTMSNVIAQYIQLMTKIEEMVERLSGVTRQRLGSVTSSELVGNVERSVQQSNYITEPLYWMHNQAKRRSLNLLINTAKEAWKNSKKKKLNYIFDDGTRAFISLQESFLYSDFDIFVSDSTKDLQNLEQLRSLLQPAMQNGASLLDAAEIMTMDDISLIKQKLGDIEQRRMDQQQQQIQQEQQNKLELQDKQNEVAQQQIQLKQTELQLKKYQIDQDNVTKLQVAEIASMKSNQGSQDLNSNGIPDQVEIANTAIKQQESQAKLEDNKFNQSLKQLEIFKKDALEKQRIENQKEIENSRIALDKERMKHETDLQKQKDKSAMEREQLKAKTALANPVVGQKSNSKTTK